MNKLFDKVFEIIGRPKIYRSLLFVLVFQLGMLAQFGIFVIRDECPKIVTVPIPVIQEKIVEKKVKDKGYHVSQKEVSDLMQRPARITQGMNPRHVRHVVESTLLYIGVPKKEVSKWADLLLITSQVESDMGYLLKQVRGPAQGIFQLEPATEKWIWTWLKKNNPELGERIKKLRCEAHLGAHEAQYNLAYATAMAYMEYHHRKVTPVGKSVMEMLHLHKRYYNTDLGKASVSNSLKKLTGSKLLSKI